MTAASTETNMTPLLEFRAPLHDGLRLLLAAANAIDIGEKWETPLAEAMTFLQKDFVPACLAENFTMLGAVNGIFGSPEAANVTMHQHDSIRRMVEDLAKLANAALEASSLEKVRRPLMMLLYGLYSVGRVHLESEETAYFGPIADHLTESQVRVMTDNLGRIAEGQSAPNQDLGDADRG